MDEESVVKERFHVVASNNYVRSEAGFPRNHFGLLGT